MKRTLATIIIMLVVASAQAGDMEAVKAANAQIAAAKAAKKEALKGLTKLQRAELRVAEATAALLKAREAEAKKDD
ncbi:MAG: hypothetical protein WCE42_02215 [Rhizobium ruizarguesonis]